jgi:hypothetical protein
MNHRTALPLLLALALLPACQSSSSSGGDDPYESCGSEPTVSDFCCHTCAELLNLDCFEYCGTPEGLDWCDYESYEDCEFDCAKRYDQYLPDLCPDCLAELADFIACGMGYSGSMWECLNEGEGYGPNEGPLWEACGEALEACCDAI